MLKFPLIINKKMEVDLWIGRETSVFYVLRSQKVNNTPYISVIVAYTYEKIKKTSQTRKITKKS